MEHDTTKKPEVRLVGADGNVFNIIGLCVQAARRAGLPKERVDQIRQDMMSQGSYDEVIRYAMTHFDVH